MLILPGLVLPGPKPEPTKYGLFSGLQSLTRPGDIHWRTGVQVESSFCSDLDSTLLSCPPDDVPKSFEAGRDFCQSDPFIVYSSLQCSPVGFTAGRFYEIVRERYEASVERAVETIFWTGQTSAGAVNPSLAFGNPSCGLVPVDLTPVEGAVSPACAVGFLESALANCWPGPGVLHMNAGALAFLDASFLVENGHTELGSRVIAGAGYPGTGPANVAVADDETWIFATSQVVGWRGDPFFNPPLFPEAVDRDINDVIVRLETEWAFSFICCIYAIRMLYCAE
jgi:hypothetical protein